MYFAVCDNEQVALERTKEIISDYIGQGHTIELFDDPDKLLAYAQENLLQAVFMDIELGKTTGIDVADELLNRKPKCQIVYLTNYIDYASDVYRTAHCGFVLKSELEERLPQVLEGIQKQLKLENTRLVLQDKAGYLVLKLDDIRYIDTEKRITRIHTMTEVIETKERVDDIAQRLPKEMFIHCHKSYIVAVSSVKKYERKRFILDQDEIVPISRAYSQDTRQAFVDWIGM